MSTSSADGFVRKRLQHAALLVLGNGGVRKRRLEEQERIGILPLDGGSDPTEMLHHELRQEVPEFRRLRLVPRGVVLDGFGTAHIVDADNQGLDLGVSGGGMEVKSEKPERH